MKESKENIRGKRFTRKEASEYLGVADGTLAVWASTGRYDLPFVKIGSRVLYFERDLNSFIERNMVTNGNAGGNHER